MKELFIKCEKCNGVGYISEHDEGYGTHDEQGCCTGSCPVQVQCGDCKATGFIPATEQSKEIEDLKKENKDLHEKGHNEFCVNSELEKRIKELEEFATHVLETCDTSQFTMMAIELLTKEN